MTTPITGSASATIQAATTTGLNTAQVVASTTTPTALEETVSALAHSLSGYTSRYMQQPTANPGMFARMERLVDSISRLIDAIANYRSSTKSEATVTAEQVAPGDTTPATIAPGTTTPPVETPVEANAATTPVPIPMPEESTTTEVTPQVAQEAAPTPQPPIELGAALPTTGGFLWKPVSDKNGDLAVLLPKQYTGRVKQVRILSPDGTKVLAKGKYSGVGNGDREHYRFNKPGNGYPDGVIVLMEMENGAIRHMKIKDTAKRTER